MKVQDVMNSRVRFCYPETSLATAAAMMLEGDCGALPVVNIEEKAVGMITDRDIAVAAATITRPASEIAVSEVISGEIYSCRSNDDIHSALKIMRHEKVRRVAVINDQGIIAGILSINDIVLRAEERRGKHEPELSYEDAMSTLKAVCEHRPAKGAISA